MNTTEKTVEQAAINQNDAMRQELARVGTLISDLARAMRVDLANADGSWPDLGGRIEKLIAVVRASPPPGNREAVIEEVRAQFKAEMDALVRTAEASPYHTAATRNCVSVMRDCAVRSFDALTAALKTTPNTTTADHGGEAADPEEARAAVFDEAAKIAVGHSNYGHIEGNKRAFAIARDIEQRAAAIRTRHDTEGAGQ